VFSITRIRCGKWSGSVCCERTGGLVSRGATDALQVQSGYYGRNCTQLNGELGNEMRHAVSYCSWLRHYATSRKAAGLVEALRYKP
jgi:hypothetical protein